MKAIGLMSGTSMDGVDAALIETDGEEVHALGPTAEFAYTEAERQILRDAMEEARGLTNRTSRGGVLATAEAMVTAKHAEAVQSLAGDHSIDLAGVDVIGFHGQTVLHRAEQRLTVQLGDGAALSGALGVPVVYDFRAADVEKGGQGAPLVPIYHRALALREKLELPAAFVNIGGIANVTYVPDGPPEALLAFDAGAGNCLLDDWALQHTGVPLDRDSRLALSGSVNRGALETLLKHPFFSLKPPKSLDRNAFALDALAGLSAADGAATLTAFTVAGIAAAAHHFPERPGTWIVSGGGTHNPHMMEGLHRVLGRDMITADLAGFSADFMEAQAFAYLAVRRLRDLPATFPGTTGVAEPSAGGVVTGLRQ